MALPRLRLLMPTPSRPWTRDELLLALNLYYRILFGRQHKGAPEVIELARMIDRTPSSVAMKLNNFTALDPDEAARGVRGLQGASTLDRATWDEFHADWESMTAQSELLWSQAAESGQPAARPASPGGAAPVHYFLDDVAPALTGDAVRGNPLPGPDTATPLAHHIHESVFSGTETEAIRMGRVRLAQAFFRRTVLAAYRQRCCVTGLDVPELLRASHIMAWSDNPAQRLNPRNGLCLSALHDAAFDRHLISFTPDEFRLVVSPRLKRATSSPVLEQQFLAYEGKPLTLPERFVPTSELLQLHGRKLQQLNA